MMSMWFYSHHLCMRGSDMGFGAEYRVLVTGKMVTCLKMKKKHGDSCLAEEQDRNRHRLETFNKVVQEGGDGKAEMCPKYYSFCPLSPNVNPQYKLTSIILLFLLLDTYFVKPCCLNTS